MDVMTVWLCVHGINLLRKVPRLNSKPLSEVEFRQKFSGSPIKRIGRNRFMRNVIYAIGNSQVVSLKSSLEPHLLSDDPVIRDAAHWASKALSS